MKRKTSVRWPRVALAAVLAMGVGCAVDENDPSTSDETQAVTGQCRINRPYGWAVGSVSCMERPSNPFYSLLDPGAPMTFRSGTVIGKGQGYVTVQCHASGDALWDEI